MEVVGRVGVAGDRAEHPFVCVHTDPYSHDGDATSVDQASLAQGAFSLGRETISNDDGQFGHALPVT